MVAVPSELSCQTGPPESPGFSGHSGGEVSAVGFLAGKLTAGHTCRDAGVADRVGGSGNPVPVTGMPLRAGADRLVPKSMTPWSSNGPSGSWTVTMNRPVAPVVRSST